MSNLRYRKDGTIYTIPLSNKTKDEGDMSIRLTDGSIQYLTADGAKNAPSATLLVAGRHFLGSEYYGFILMPFDGMSAGSIINYTIPVGTCYSFLASGNHTIVGIKGLATSSSAFYCKNESASSYTAVSLPFEAVWAKVAFGNGIFMAISGTPHHVAISSTGSVWTGYSSALSLVAGTGYFKDICYGNGIWIATGRNGSAKIAAYSINNGITWVAASISVSELTISESYKTEYGKSKFISITGSANTLIKSTTGSAWTSFVPNALGKSGNPFVAVAYWNGRWFAIQPGAGGSGISYSDDDGDTWEATTTTAFDSTMTADYCIARGNGTFVLARLGQGVYSSPNGLIWTNEHTKASTMSSIIYYRGFFVSGSYQTDHVLAGG